LSDVDEVQGFAVAVRVVTRSVLLVRAKRGYRSVMVGVAEIPNGRNQI
jgi:hypothetical protein